MNILVTGGLGYIGSHTCVDLVEKGHNVVIIDNLVNSSIDVFANLVTISGCGLLSFHKCDMTEYSRLESIFMLYHFDCVIHFAALKSVPESIQKPLKYYHNNLLSLINLCDLCAKHDVTRIIYSSSASVYGVQTAPYSEKMDLCPRSNPYAETKAISEKILYDLCGANSKLLVTVLRYFNPIGAHSSGLLGDVSKEQSGNLMPIITKVALGEQRELVIYGNDYDTPDGTCIRDYIHVEDLAKGHIAALDKMVKGYRVFNLGTGRGTSVLELVRAFEKINSVCVPYRFSSRREGDVAISYANVSLAEEELQWKAHKDIEQMCADSWHFVNERSKGI